MIGEYIHHIIKMNFCIEQFPLQRHIEFQRGLILHDILDCLTYLLNFDSHIQ